MGVCSCVFVAAVATAETSIYCGLCDWDLPSWVPSPGKLLCEGALELVWVAPAAA